jgi:hypothetical protein
MRSLRRGRFSMMRTLARWTNAGRAVKALMEGHAERSDLRS